MDEESKVCRNKDMIYKYNKNLVPYAQELRKNMTPEEKHLWYDFLKLLPLTVNRQKIIDNYIVDFFIAAKRIAIEVDGSQHGFAENYEADKKRDRELNNLGIKVLRYKNSDVDKNFNTVCRDILKHLEIEESDIEVRKTH